MERFPAAVRPASPEDAEALLEIYAPYVRETAITFEYDVPSPEAFRRRIENTLKRYPYLVAEAEGALLGYAYAGPFHTRAAYDCPPRPASTSAGTGESRAWAGGSTGRWRTFAGPRTSGT